MRPFLHRRLAYRQEGSAGLEDQAPDKDGDIVRGIVRAAIHNRPAHRGIHRDGHLLRGLCPGLHAADKAKRHGGKEHKGIAFRLGEGRQLLRLRNTGLAGLPLSLHLLHLGGITVDPIHRPIRLPLLGDNLVRPIVPIHPGGQGFCQVQGGLDGFANAVGLSVHFVHGRGR